MSDDDARAYWDDQAATFDVVVHPLTDPVLWGGPITDERYAVTATRGLR